jgi:hypothetical protein
MEQRRTRRFKLELPMSITRAGAARLSLAAKTKNISSTGVLFTAPKEPDLGGAIEYVITLNHEGPQPVLIRCVGKVLRTEPAPRLTSQAAPDFEIAATLERYEFVRDRVRQLAGQLQ